MFPQRCVVAEGRDFLCGRGPDRSRSSSRLWAGIPTLSLPQHAIHYATLHCYYTSTVVTVPSQESTHSTQHHTPHHTHCDTPQTHCTAPHCTSLYSLPGSMCLRAFVSLLFLVTLLHGPLSPRYFSNIRRGRLTMCSHFIVVVDCCVGSARDGPGPAHQLLRHSEQGVLFGPSMVCDSRMAVDNKMSMVAASLGHYQAR